MPQKNECFEVKKIREEIARLEGIKNPNLHERLKLGWLRKELTVATVVYIDNPSVNEPEKEPAPEPPFNGVLKEMDFTGCHPFIAEQLKKGMMVLCDVGPISKPVFVFAYNSKTDRYLAVGDTHYFTLQFSSPTPVESKPPVARIKPLHEIIKWCVENGWVFDQDGDFYNPNDTPEFVFYAMGPFCGKPMCADAERYTWHPEWLEME